MTQALLLALIYFCADRLLNGFCFDVGWSVFWPLNGFTVALLMQRERASWPLVLLGVAVGTGLGESRYHHARDSVALQVAQRFLSLVEVTLSAWALPRFRNLPQWLREPRIVLRFTAALLLGPGISGILCALLYHHLRGMVYTAALQGWAVSDALGIAVTLPAALAFRSPEMRALARPGAFSILGVVLLAGAVSLSTDTYPLLFLLYPSLLFLDSRLGFAGASVATTFISIMAVYLATVLHVGPFGSWNAHLPVSRDTALQMFLGFHVLALLPSSVVIMERKRISEELRATNEQLAGLVALDGLTGIANRRALDGKFAEEWSRAMRLGSSLAFIMIDIDHFKQYNDRYGHLAGDACLRAVADAMHCAVHRPGDLLARFGGEEFALLLPHTDLHGALQIAETLRSSCFDLALEHRHSEWQRVTVSVGCSAALPIVGGDKLQLLQDADAALYRAKRQGRNRVEASGAMFYPELDPEPLLLPDPSMATT